MVKNAEEIIQEMGDFYDKAKKDREVYEKDWYFDVAFYLGYQWISWNEWTRRIEEPKAPTWRVRIVANQIAPICNQIIAKLTKNKPIWQTIPATSEDTDVNAARMGEKVLRYLARILKYQTKTQEMWLWSVLTGSAFKLPYWDATAKQAITADGKVHLGEVGIDILSCFEVYPEVGATSERFNKVMICRTFPLDYIKEQWDNGDEVSDESISGKTPVEERLFDLMKKSAPGYTPPKNQKEEKSGNAIIKEYREIPSKKFPKGRQVIVAGKVVLESGDLPHKFLIRERKLGLIKYDYEKIPGRFWGKGRPQDLIPLQKEYNKTRSQIIEIKNLMAKPKWGVPIGSGIKKTHLTSEPGEIVYYNPGVPEPKPLAMASLPAYVLREPDVTRRDMQDVSGIHEVSKAQTPAGVRSGVAIRYLQEQDDTRLGPVIMRYEENEAELGGFLLALTREHYIEPRLIRIIGKNGQVEAFDFKKSYAADNMDVIVQAGSAFPLNKVAKQEFVLGLWREKVITDQSQILKMLEFGTFEEIYEDFALDEKRAQEENALMARGTQITVKWYDNDDIHIYEHQRYIKANNLPPEVEALFEFHIIREHAPRKMRALQALPLPEEMSGKQKPKQPPAKQPEGGTK